MKPLVSVGAIALGILGLVVITQGYTKNLQAGWNALWGQQPSSGSGSLLLGINPTDIVNTGSGGFIGGDQTGGFTKIPLTGEHYSPAGFGG